MIFDDYVEGAVLMHIIKKTVILLYDGRMEQRFWSQLSNKKNPLLYFRLLIKNLTCRGMFLPKSAWLRLGQRVYQGPKWGGARDHALKPFNKNAHLKGWRVEQGWKCEHWGQTIVIIRI